MELRVSRHPPNGYQLHSMRRYGEHHNGPRCRDITRDDLLELFNFRCCNLKLQKKNCDEANKIKPTTSTTTRNVKIMMIVVQSGVKNGVWRKRMTVSTAVYARRPAARGAHAHRQCVTVASLAPSQQTIVAVASRVVCDENCRL